MLVSRTRAVRLSALAALTSLSLLARPGPDAHGFERLRRVLAPSPAPTAILWEGGFETGGLPPGSITGGGTADSQYAVIHQQGGPGYSSIVSTPTRTRTSSRALKVVMPAFSQREQLVSRHTWTPDDRGSVDEYYGFSMYYAPDWNEGGGISREISGTYWHNPVSWRMAGDNGSLNFSGDLVDGKPHLMLRRNTVKNREGFYRDGLGLDKIDAGPVVVGQWMDFVVHIRWSTTSQGALREVWRDGVFMGRSTSLNAVDSAKHVLRIGQYQTTEIAHTRTTFFDNVRVGKSYAAVDPSR